MKVKIKKLFPDALLPEYSDGCAFDLFACLNRNELIKSGERRIIPCGVSISVPEGYCLFIIPRSGLSVRHGITVHNSPGLICPRDNEEIRVILHNDFRDSFSVFPGARIAQALIIQIPFVEWDMNDE